MKIATQEWADEIEIMLVGGDICLLIAKIKIVR